jgi:superfamily II DNA or RNA helicase
MVTIKIEDGLYVYNLPLIIRQRLQSDCYFTLESDEQVEYVNLYSEDKDYVKIPRGLLYNLIKYLEQANLSYKLEDQEHKYTDQSFRISPNINYTTGPFAYQGDAVKSLLKHKVGRFQSAAGSGKTICMNLIIGLQNKGPILFLADKDILLRQFTREVEKVLGIPKEDIGLIKQKQFSIKPITVGSLRTIGKSSFDIERLRNQFYMVLYDEVHFSSALTSRNAILNLGAERLYGFSATPEHYRDEQKNKLMEALFGPIQVHIPETSIPKRLTPVCMIRKTNLNFYYNFSNSMPQWAKFKAKHSLEEDISNSIPRNLMIITDTYNLVKTLNHKVIMCVNRVDHGKTLANLLREQGLSVSFPYKSDNKGGFSVDHKQLDLDVEAVKDNLIDVIVGTYKLFDTGFNVPQLSAIQLVGPFTGKNTTTMIQSTGRILRYLPEKAVAVVLDYQDKSNPHSMLTNWSIERENTLKALYNNVNYI